MKEEEEAARGLEAPPGGIEASNNVEAKAKADEETPKFGTLMVWETLSS